MTKCYQREGSRLCQDIAGHLSDKKWLWLQRSTGPLNMYRFEFKEDSW